MDAAVESAKQTAEKVGEAIEEGADVVGDKAIDAKITAEIKTRFAADDTVKALSINGRYHRQTRYAQRNGVERKRDETGHPDCAERQ